MNILLEHGDGGSQTRKLVADLFRTAFEDELLDEEGDAAILPFHSGHPAVTTDSFVVSPLEFPGGNIGTLAIAGTVNDLAVSGAVPHYLTAGFILEEGLEGGQLRRIVSSMARTAREAGVRIVAGDTKVVERGRGDGVYINTTGVGYVPEPDRLGFHRIQPGDRVVVSGGLAEHAVAVLAGRAGIEFEVPVQSDCRPLNRMIRAMLAEFRTVRFMRDPTRGGLATALKEVALRTGLDIELEEQRLPIRREVRGALELLGMDPLYLASEGKVVAVVAPEEAEGLVRFLRQHPGQELAAEVGRVTLRRDRPSGGGLAGGSGSSSGGDLRLQTPYGGTRSLDLQSGAPLPRIC